MGSVRRFVHKQNFLLLEGFLDLFSVIWREAFFSGTYFACEDGFSKRLVLIFKCLLPFSTLAADITKMATLVFFWVYINSVTLTHTFRIARITIRKILFSGLRKKYYAKTTLDSTMASTNSMYTGSTG